MQTLAGASGCNPNPRWRVGLQWIPARSASEGIAARRASEGNPSPTTHPLGQGRPFMKLRHPWLIKSAAYLGSFALRLWCGTLRYSFRPIGPDVDPLGTGPEEHYVYAFWHETLALVATRYRVKGSRVLVSKSADGDL